MFMAGISWAVFYAQHALQHRLPESLAGETILVQGTIVGIPQNDAATKRFYLLLDSFQSPLKIEKPPRKLRLSWYSNRSARSESVNAGEKWQFEVRLKPPHGFYNPGGFDYEGWLFQQGIDATGYVRASEKNIRLSAGDGTYFSSLWSRTQGGIDAYRQQISESIRHREQLGAGTETDMTGLVTALAVGDRGGVKQQQWQELLYTGTNHLMAISGLHIGLAYLSGFLIGRWLLPVAVMKYIPAQQVGIVVGILVALAYALLAGLSIPTQRALIMMLSFAGAALLRRYFRPVDALGLALFLVLLWDPLSVLSAGFWFSFAAVGVIFYTLSEDRFKNLSGAEKSVEYSGVSRFMRLAAHRLLLWSSLQFAITLALFPLSLYLFQQGSLIAPLANLVLVPYVSFLVVPVILLALLLYPVSIHLSEVLFGVAAQLLQWVWPFIRYLSELPFAYYVNGSVSIQVLLVSILAIGILLLPSKFWSNCLSGRALAFMQRFGLIVKLLIFLLLIAPLLLRNSPQVLAEGEFSLSVLDVGQGLANVIQTSNHSLVFDSGAKLSEKLDAGSSVVVPFLRANGIRSLDMLMISHGDADHIGGAGSILKAYPQARLLGQDLASLEHDNPESCRQGQHWQWDGVDFMILHPADSDGRIEEPRSARLKRNNHSCVLRVSSAAGSVLLTGDIEKKVEKQLVKQQAEWVSANVLVSPHHGSKTSSSKVFLDTVKPELAIFSSGYRNRYRLPNDDVRQRYRQRGIKTFQTGHRGAVLMTFKNNRGLTGLTMWRDANRHYWNHIVENAAMK